MHRDHDVRDRDVAHWGKPSPFIHASLYGSLIAGVLLGALACSSDSTGPKSTVPTLAQAYWQLQLNQHAVTMALTAPVNTIQLVATPLNVYGAPISGLGQVSYTPSDSVVHVDSTGLVTAQFATQPDTKTFVVASLTDSRQHVTLVDTCFIQITDAAPNKRMASFSIQPLAGDSTKRAYNQISTIYTVTARAVDNDSVNFTGFFSYFYSSNTHIAAIDKNIGAVFSIDLGHVTLYAQTWSYGVVAADSLQFEITPSINSGFGLVSAIPTGSTRPVLTFWPSIITVGVGANVTWSNSSYNDTVDVVFDDPTDADSVEDKIFGFATGFGTGKGNILPWVKDTLGIGSDIIANKINQWCRGFYGQFIPGIVGCPSNLGITAQRTRLFPVAGVYHFHSTKQPTSGTLYVQ